MKIKAYFRRKIREGPSLLESDLKQPASVSKFPSVEASRLHQAKNKGRSKGRNEERISEVFKGITYEKQMDFAILGLTRKRSVSSLVSHPMKKLIKQLTETSP